jgi:hypothetical protein
VDHGFGAGGEGLIVAGKTAVHHDPTDTPLDRPAPLHDVKPPGIRVSVDDFAKLVPFQRKAEAEKAARKAAKAAKKARAKKNGKGNGKPKDKANAQAKAKRKAKRRKPET